MTEFFDIEMQRMIVHTVNINERKSLSLTNHIFNFTMPSIQDCVKTILDKSPINKRSAKVSPEIKTDLHHVVIDIRTPSSPKCMNDFDADDLESQHICYENMFCRENRRIFMNEEKEDEKHDK